MKHGKKIQEKILLARAQNNDPEAYGEIFSLYVDRIYRFVFFKVSSREEAEDITSDVFLRVWQYISTQQKEVKNLNALLYQSARNSVIDFYRKKAQVEMVNQEDILKSIEDKRQQNLLLQIEITTDIERVTHVLKTLKDEYKDVILLRYVEELSIHEISVIFNKSRGAVRVLLHRAIKILREKLQ